MQTTAHTTPLVFHSSDATPLFGGASDEYRELEAQLAEWFLKLSIQCVRPRFVVHGERAEMYWRQRPMVQVPAPERPREFRDASPASPPHDGEQDPAPLPPDALRFTHPR
ncbi:hypothetical protein C8R44DRAFT_185249 [Mycena epipterygia]|nr:hypothetical protein C8R44DRAFT_185249 [Mycena epipterygia]